MGQPLKFLYEVPSASRFTEACQRADTSALSQAETCVAFYCGERYLRSCVPCRPQSPLLAMAGASCRFRDGVSATSRSEASGDISASKCERLDVFAVNPLIRLRRLKKPRAARALSIVHLQEPSNASSTANQQRCIACACSHDHRHGVRRSQ